MEKELFEARSTPDEDGTGVRLTLRTKATGQQIIEVLEAAVRALDAGSNVVERYIVKGMPFNMGKVILLKVECGGAVIVGTRGEYPSANMIFFINGVPVIVPNWTYDVGTVICVIHCKWKNHPWKHDLSLIPDIYRSIRCVFTGLVEQELRRIGV